jgi:hypothetical protein
MKIAWCKPSASTDSIGKIGLNQLPSGLASFLSFVIVIVFHALPAAAQAPGPNGEVIRLRAYGVPTGLDVGPTAEAQRQIMEAFHAKYPWIVPVSTTGLQLPGLSTNDVVPMMQIAGGIPNHVLYVNFRQSHTYISKKLLYPLDRYLEVLAGVIIDDSAAMTDEQYVDALRQGANWPQIELRVPRQCWEVMRRECPYHEHCPHRHGWDLEPVAKHEHIWAYPVGRW